MTSWSDPTHVGLSDLDLESINMKGFLRLFMGLSVLSPMYYGYSGSRPTWHLSIFGVHHP